MIKVAINVKTNTRAAQQLTDLSIKRKANEELNRSKQDIVAELINAAHKKEC